MSKYTVAAWDLLAAGLLIAGVGGVRLGPASRDFVAPKEVSLAGVALLAAGAVAIELWTNRSVTDGYVYRGASWLFHGWSAAVSRSRLRWLGAMTVAMAALGSASSLRRHWAFGSNSFDLGIYTNALWNLTHGHGYVSSLKDGMHLFGDHQTPTYWLVAPLFAMWPSPELLLILQACAYATAGGALWYLAMQHGRGLAWTAAALPLLYWSYLPTRNANAFDARPDSFMVPLLLWGIVGVQGRSGWSRLGGGLALTLAFGCKETAALLGIVVGVAWILGAGPETTRPFTRRVGAIVAPVAALILWFDLQVLPALVGHTYPYAGLYGHIGDSPLDLVLAPVMQADYFWAQLIRTDVLSYLFWTLAPLGFLPVLDWTTWLVATPGYLALFLANTPYRVDIAFQYSNEASIGLWWGMARVLPRLDALPLRHVQVWLAAWALAASGGLETRRLQHYRPSGYTRWVQEALVPALDPHAPLAASDALVPHVATRFWVRSLRNPGGPSGEPVDCLITDPSVSNVGLSPSEVADVERRAVSQGYRREFTCGTVQVFSREQDCLTQPVECGL